MTSPTLGGRFRLGAPLGGHRTGEVFEAVDVSTGQPCVVKRIAPNVFPTPLTAQRAERELRQLAKMQTSRIVRVLDVGRDDDRLWVALELATGATLGELVQMNGPLAVKQAVRTALEIGEALVDAAKLGVIHRDVAPKNILVDGDYVKVLNFGVPTPTTDKVFGVPEFLSPEQVEGRPVDQRSTIYSLASLLQYMLTGDAPFQGETAEVLQKQVSSPPPPASSKAPSQGIPVELDRVLLRAMEKQSSRRHLTLRQLLSELEPFAGPALIPRPGASAPIPVRPSPTAEPAPAPVAVPVPAPAAAPVAIPVPAPVAIPVPAPAPAPAAAPAPVPAAAPAPAPTPVSRPHTQPGRHNIRETLIGMPIAPARHAEVPRPMSGVPAIPSIVIEGTPTEQNPVVSEAAVVVAEPAPALPVSAPAAAVVAEPVPPPVVVPPSSPPQMYVVPNPAPAAVAPEPARPVLAATPQSGPATGKKKPTGSQKSPGGKKGKFRETMWFKKGELDEAAAAAAAKAKPEDLTSDKADEAPIEERYKDDGTLTAADRDRLSLRTGGTQMGPAIREVPPVVPGEKMGEQDLVGEMKAGRGKVFVILFIALALVAALVVIFVLK